MYKFLLMHWHTFKKWYFSIQGIGVVWSSPLGDLDLKVSWMKSNAGETATVLRALDMDECMPPHIAALAAAGGRRGQAGAQKQRPLPPPPPRKVLRRGSAALQRLVDMVGRSLKVRPPPFQLRPLTPSFQTFCAYMLIPMFACMLKCKAY